MTAVATPSMWPRELPDTIELACDRTALPDDARPEPSLAAVPFFIEYDEPARLDPERVGLLWELPPRTRNPIRARGPFSSLLIHLLPWVTVLGWPHTAMELPRPIPVQLVLEQPPPEPPPPSLQPPEPAIVRTSGASAGGEVKPPDPGTATDTAPAAAGEKQPSPPLREARLVVPPPVPPLKPLPPLREPSAFKLPKPVGAPVAHHADRPHPTPRAARYPGPAATHDEYLAYLAEVTMQHVDLVPASVVGGRRGEAILSVAIRDDGSISQIVVLRSSGWPDLDQRVEMMVRAVGKFPPLPQWFQGNVMETSLTVHFPL